MIFWNWKSIWKKKYLKNVFIFSKTQDATIPLTSDEKTSQETNNLSSSKCVPEKRDWHHLMENLQQTVEESRRIREKYYSKKSSASSNSSWLVFNYHVNIL